MSKQQNNKESRSGLLQFLEDALNNNKINGLEWIDREKKIWQLPWKHHRPTRWGDPDAFVLREIGKHMYGFTGTEPAQEDLKNWKEKFRNALRSLGVKELEEHRNQEGSNPIKVYQFNNDPRCGRKTRGRNRGETGSTRRSNKPNQIIIPQDISSSSSGSDIFDQSTDFMSFSAVSFRSRSPVSEFTDINTDGFSGNLDSYTPNIPHNFIVDSDVAPNLGHNLTGRNNLSEVGTTFKRSSIPLLSPLVGEGRKIVENIPNHCTKIFSENAAMFNNLQHSSFVTNNLSTQPCHQMNITGDLVNEENMLSTFCINKENHHKGIINYETMVGTSFELNNGTGHAIMNGAGHAYNGTGHAIMNGAGHSITNGAGHATMNGAGHSITNGAGHTIMNGAGHANNGTGHTIINGAGNSITNGAGHSITNGAGHAIMNGAGHANNGTGHTIMNVAGLSITNGTRHTIMNGAGHAYNGSGQTFANTAVYAINNGSAEHAGANGAGYALTHGAGYALTHGADDDILSTLDMNIPLDYHFMNFLEDQSLPLMVLEVKYHDETALYQPITEDTFRFCYVPNSKRREVIASCPSDEQFGPKDAKLIELPSAHLCQNLDEKQVAVTQGVLNNMERGVTIFYRDGDIYAKRLCKAVPFYLIPKEVKSQKLERETEVKIFDYNNNFLKSVGHSQPFVVMSFSVRDPDRLAPVLSVKVSHMRATQQQRRLMQQQNFSIPIEPECSLSNEFDTRLKIEQNLLSI